MYGKTNLGGSAISPRGRRALAAAGAAVVLGFGGLAAWAALAPDAYTGSGAGCVNVTVPNSTGGATLHYCGDAARTFCRRSLRTTTAVALRARPQCRLAGLSP